MDTSDLTVAGVLGHRRTVNCWCPKTPADLAVASVQRTPAISKSPVSLVPEDISDQYIAGVHRADTRDLLVAGVPVVSF